jgi:F-type H+-transporting ATPase subunit b
MPQFDPQTFLPQLFWLAVLFGILYLLMSRVALPRVAEVLETRQDRIAHDLDRAEELKKQAETVLKAYEAAAAEARGKAQILLAEAAAQSQAEANRRNDEIAARLAREGEAAAERIDRAKAQAMQQVSEMAAGLAAEAARKIAGVQVSAGEARAAVEKALKERG